MATSSYKNYLDSVIDTYVGRLIQNITQIDESSDNFPIATKFAKSNLLYHRFLDTNKNEIQRNIQGIIEKLLIHSQTEKAERLSLLLQKFLTKPLKKDVPDVHYAVLSMILHLSTNPLESVYYETQFKTKVDSSEQFDNELRRELNIEEQVREEWGYSEEESIEEEEDAFEEEIPANEQIIEANNKLKSQSLLTKAKDDSRIEIEPSPSKRNEGNQQFSMLDKSLLFGTLPMQSFDSFSGPKVFRLPLTEAQPNNVPQNLDPNLSSNIPKSQGFGSFFIHHKTPSKEELQRSAKKRNYTQYTEEDSADKSKKAVSPQTIHKFEEDKQFIESKFLQKNIWRNPNSLNEILQDFYLRPDAKGRVRGDFTGLNHWVFTLKTERALIQDIIFMINGVESDSFQLDQNQRFEKRMPIQLKHVSPEALTRVVESYIALANDKIEISSNLKALSENFNTTVIEGFIECVNEFNVKYQSYLEDIQCIFLKQASQVKPKNLGTRHPDLEAYLEKKTITMVELLKILDPYMKNFHMVGEITKNLLKTFKEAASELEQVARGETTPSKVKELKPFISMTTLSYLYRLLTDTILGTNEDSTNLLLIKLFFKSWEPYLSILDKWLKHGTLMDKYSEFFIKYNMDLNMITNFYSKLNWTRDYVFQTYTVKWKVLNEEKTFVCVPSFLSKYAETIVTIGKTIKVLGYLIHQENLYLYLSKLDFKEEFFFNLLKRMEEDEPEQNMNSIIEYDSCGKSQEEDEPKIEVKDYTFGAKLRNNGSLKNNNKKPTQENILYNSLPKKFDVYMSSPELTKFSINAFSITKPLINGKPAQNSQFAEIKAERNMIEETPLRPDSDKNINCSIIKFYNKVMSKKGQESLNNLKIYLDYEVENLLVNMESHYSTQLTDLLFNHFHLMEYLRIFRNVFFVENGSIYESFIHEAILKVRSPLLESNLVKLNQLFMESMKKIQSDSVKNIPSMFVLEADTKEEPSYSFSVLNNFSVAHKPTYPLDIIFDQEILTLYNRIFKFILQIKRAKYALTINNIPLKRQIKVEDLKEEKLDESSDIFGNEMEEEDPYSWNKKITGETARTVREANLLKRKFALNQKELLHFVNNLEFFVGVSVIDEHTKNYEKIIQDSANITEINRNLKEYLQKIAEICQLYNKKNDMLFELLKSTLNLCWDFYNLYNRLEERLAFISGNESSLTKIWSELDMIMASFQENNKMILQILNQYHQKGHKLQIKSLFSNLNFNYFYLGESGDYIR